ncbi:MAG: IS481 family transposase [Actinomycetota bacterium]
MAHPRARLTPFGRRLLVERIEVLGWTPAEAATSAGVSRSTAYKWIKRFREEGSAGLEDRPSRPHRSPHRLSRRDEREILRVRRRSKRGPHSLAARLGRPRSTIYGVLRRHGMNRLDHADRPTGVPIRYCKERPGELLHLDVKKLGRVPPGGGHRMRGRSTTTVAGKKRRRVGYDFLHVAVDDHSRVAYVRVFSDERGETAGRFLLEAASHFAELGVRIERVMTDRAKCYVESRDFGRALDRIGARHKPTRGYRPQTNGKAERFIRTMLTEWAYAKLHRSNSARLKALPGWVHRYNFHRPHTALGGQPPMVAFVDKVGGNYT